jgi:GTPase SAR1 family protein
MSEFVTRSYSPVIGNKLDESGNRAVSTKEGKAYAEQHQMLYYEVSAKDNINIEKAFKELAQLALERTGKLEKFAVF